MRFDDVHTYLSETESWIFQVHVVLEVGSGSGFKYEKMRRKKQREGKQHFLSTVICRLLAAT